MSYKTIFLAAHKCDLVAYRNHDLMQQRIGT